MLLLSMWENINKGDGKDLPSSYLQAPNLACCFGPFPCFPSTSSFSTSSSISSSSSSLRRSLSNLLWPLYLRYGPSIILPASWLLLPLPLQILRFRHQQKKWVSALCTLGILEAQKITFSHKVQKLGAQFISGWAVLSLRSLRRALWRVILLLMSIDTLHRSQN